MITIAEHEQRSIDAVLEALLAAYHGEPPAEEPLTDEELTEMMHAKRLSPAEAVAQGIIGAWVNLGIEDGAAWVNEQKAKRKARRQ